MKKLLIILLCFTMIPAITVFGAFTTEEVEYTYTITNDKWFNLTTGVFENNVDYNTTNRIPIKYDSINLSSFTSFHHLLFFNHNEYLGYYNSQYSYLEIGDKFLGQINTFTPTIPTNATHFVIQNYNNYKNLVPIAELNNNTLKEVFEDNYNSLFNTHQLVNNGDFNNATNDWFSDGTSSLTYINNNNGWLNYTYNGTAIGLLQTNKNVSLIDGNKYYIYSISKSSNEVVMNLYFRDGVTFSVGDNFTLTNTFIIFSSIKTNTTTALARYAIRLPLSNNLETIISHKEIGSFNISTLIANKQYSPLYNTTFDLMTDADIKTSMDLFVSKRHLFIDYKTFGIDNLTVSQMDSLYSLYVSNLANDIYYTSYRDLNVTNPGISYIYQKEIPDNTQPIDKLENFLDDLGLGSKAVKLTIAIVVIATTMILLVMVFKAPALIIIIASSLELVLFVFMGWIPNYVIIVLAVLLFILIIKERSGNNEA